MVVSRRSIVNLSQLLNRSTRVPRLIELIGCDGLCEGKLRKDLQLRGELLLVRALDWWLGESM